MPTLVERTASHARDVAVDSSHDVDAVQEAVNQYNQSGNPGQFAVVQDGEYFHIQQTMRTVGGSLEPFKPISDTVVNWQAKSRTCQQVLADLSLVLQQVRSVGLAEGNVPIKALLMTHCNVEGGSLTIRQILKAVADDLDTDPVSGQKTASDVWDLVYDPNMNKYFVSLYLVRRNTPAFAEKASGPISPAPNPRSGQGQSRTGAYTGTQRHN